jgi:cell division protein FtsI (penicillin-binding protein 3)
MAKPSVRLATVEVAFAIGVIAVIVRAGQVQLVDGARYAAQARESRTESVVLPARRGTIFDRAGVPLAVTQESYHLGLAPRELRDTDRDVQILAKQLGLSTREIRRALRKSWAYFDGPFTAAQVYPLRKIRGVHLTNDFVRFYPDPDLARAVLGRPAADGRPASGIERVFDSTLAGEPGSAVVLRDGQGRTIESPARLGAFPVPGEDVYLTLDAGVQEIAQRALGTAIQRLHAAGGDVVVLEPSTGEILAVASRRADGSPSTSAFTSVFEPGSTAKIFEAAALLQDHLVTSTDSVWGEHGVWKQRYREIHDDHPEGWMTLSNVIEVSSNIGAAKFAERLTPDQQFGMLRAFGLGTPTGVEFPAESRGRLPAPADWSGTTSASLAMGYEVAVTPLQLAAAYAAIANDGVLLQPTLIKEIRAPDGSVVYTHQPEPVRRVVSPDVAAHLRAMLRNVVDRGGTGASAALTTYSVAGKTGTARLAGPKGYLSGEYTAVFASIFPAEDPQLAMVVRLDDPRGGYAALTAAPVTRQVLEEILGARTEAIDRRRLSNEPPPAPPDQALIDAGTVPYVVQWPDTGAPAPAGPRPVPDVIGLSPREAVRRVLRVGLNARLEGLGTISRTRPAVGDSVKAGGVVVLYGRGGSR